MTSSRDDATQRRYREASAALDERPSDAARAAILAAAAREVKARPVAADAPRPVARRRWPLAAAATVLLSTLAALVATHTEQEMPTFNAPAERVQDKVAVAPAQRPQLQAPMANAPAGSASSVADSAAAEKNAAPAATAPQMARAPTAAPAPNTTSAQAPTTPPAPPPATTPAKPADGRVTSDSSIAGASNADVGNKLSKTIVPMTDTHPNVRSVEEARARADAPQPAAEPVARAKANVANEGDTRSSDAQSTEAKRRAFPGAAPGALQSAPSAPPAVTASPPAPPAAALPQSQAAGRDGETNAADSLKREQSYGERATARRDAAPAVQGAMRQEAAPKESVQKDYEATPDAWIDHIVRLRRDGRQDEADAELKRLRERYPDYRVPPMALRPSGTR